MSKQSAERRLDDTEASAFLRALRTSPRKLNLVAESIIRLTVSHLVLPLAPIERTADDLATLVARALPPEFSADLSGKRVLVLVEVAVRDRSEAQFPVKRVGVVGLVPRCKSQRMRYRPLRHARESAHPGPMLKMPPWDSRLRNELLVAHRPR